MEININTKKVKITELQPNKWNPKLKPDEDSDVAQQFKEVVKSIKTYGLVDPIMVRSLENDEEKPYEIINGHHRFMACQQLGYTEVVINDLGKISDLEAKKLTIVTEDIKIPIDEIKLSELLKEMLNSEDLDKLAEGLPYSKELIASKIELLDFDWEKLSNQEGDINEEAEMENITIPEGAASMTLIFDSEEQRKRAEIFFDDLKKKYKTTNFANALVLFIKENNYDRSNKERGQFNSSDKSKNNELAENKS